MDSARLHRKALHGYFCLERYFPTRKYNVAVGSISCRTSINSSRRLDQSHSGCELHFFTKLIYPCSACNSGLRVSDPELLTVKEFVVLSPYVSWLRQNPSLFSVDASRACLYASGISESSSASIHHVEALPRSITLQHLHVSSRDETWTTRYGTSTFHHVTAFPRFHHALHAPHPWQQCRSTALAFDSSGRAWLDQSNCSSRCWGMQVYHNNIPICPKTREEHLEQCT